MFILPFELQSNCQENHFYNENVTGGSINSVRMPLQNFSSQNTTTLESKLGKEMELRDGE